MAVLQSIDDAREEHIGRDGVTAAAYAASAQTIYACKNNFTGVLRVVSSWVWHVWPGSIHGALVVKLVEAFHMSGFGMCGQLWPMHQKEQLLQLTFPGWTTLMWRKTISPGPLPCIGSSQLVELVLYLEPTE
jgi:hypothetical protein